jgi:hypothetical protein
VQRYRIDFEYLGRDHAPPPLETVASTADQIAEAVYNYARTRLISREVVAIADLDKMEVAVTAGMHRAGVGAIIPLED